MPEVPPKQPVTGFDSVKMDTGAGLPRMGGDEIGDAIPVTPSPPPPPPPGSNASSALVTMHDAAMRSGGDAFPVLKAFQDYLEAERQRARRRMTILGCVFAAVMVVVVGAFMAIWFATMRNMQATNAQLLQAALSSREREAPQPVVVQQPAQPSATDTAKIVAEAVSRAQAEQSAAFAKTLEDMTASLAAMRESNLKAENDRRLAEEAAQKALADKAAAEQAAKEAARKALAEKAAAEKAAAEKAAKLAAQKAAAEKAAAEKAAAEKLAAERAAAVKRAEEAKAAAELAAAEKAKKQGPDIPKFDAPPPPEGFVQESMALRLPKEQHPVFWRIYMPK